ncbi:MAG: DUF2089 domain-containing protein [Chloroflexi bacterium]|nr:DUF2089 domain-containing protein [Chloroflexota bacterium]
MSDERLRILKMVEEGKLSAEEAARLLSALSEAPRATQDAPSSTDARRPRWLRVQVLEGNGRRVQVNVPVSLVDIALRIAARTAALKNQESQQMLQALKDAIASGEIGRIIEVVDESDGDRVEIFLE